MKVAVIAANGRSGRAFVRSALQAGHQVRAGARRVDALQPQPGLTTVTLDATRPEDLHGLFDGQEAVVSLIGHVRGSAADLQTVVMRHTLTVMGDLGIRRLVSLTGTGVRFPADRFTVIDRLLNASIGVIDPERIADGKHAAQVLTASDREWTLLRVLKLTTGAPRPFALGTAGPSRILAPRREVAAAILQVLQESSFLKQAPVLIRPSGPGPASEGGTASG